LLIDVPCSEGMIGIGPSAESAWQAAGLIDLLRGLADSVALGLSRQGDISRRQQAERGLDELGEMLIETELLNRLRRGLAGAASPAGMMDIVAEHALECSRSVGEVAVEIDINGQSKRYGSEHKLVDVLFAEAIGWGNENSESVAVYGRAQGHATETIGSASDQKTQGRSGYRAVTSARKVRPFRSPRR